MGSVFLDIPCKQALHWPWSWWVHILGLLVQKSHGGARLSMNLSRYSYKFVQGLLLWNTGNFNWVCHFEIYTKPNKVTLALKEINSSVREITFLYCLFGVCFHWAMTSFLLLCFYQTKTIYESLLWTIEQSKSVLTFLGMAQIIYLKPTLFDSTRFSFNLLNWVCAFQVFNA